jgi:hypothetical protein
MLMMNDGTPASDLAGFPDFCRYSAQKGWRLKYVSKLSAVLKKLSSTLPHGSLPD